MAATQVKAAMLTPYPFVPPRNGGQWAVWGYCKHLAAVWPVTIVGCEENGEAPEFSLLRLFRHTPSKYLNPAMGRTIRRLLIDEQIKIVALQHHYLALLMWPFSRGLGIKMAIFSHNIEYQRWRSLGKWWWPLMYISERWAYRRADAVFFISPQELDAAPALFGLPAAKCHYAPFPVAFAAVDFPNTPTIRKQVRQSLGITEEVPVFLFFGPQSYAPNRDAVEAIAKHILPYVKTLLPDFRIWICGGGLPEELSAIKDMEADGLQYLGFVDNIHHHILAADVVLNPILSGAGVKTKLLEAISLGKTVVSTQTGALGTNVQIMGSKLITVQDDDWLGFAGAMIAALAKCTDPTPESFYEEHYKANALKDVLNWLESCSAVSNEI